MKSDADRPTRLSTIEETAVRLRPLRRAEREEDYFLYWIPVDFKPAPTEQRVWLNAFLDRLSDYLTKQCSLRAEVFLRYKTVHPDLMDTFLEQSLELIPIMGFGRKPGVPLPAIPTLEDLKPLGEGKPFNFGDYVGDYIYWFLGKNERKERECFLGHGGLTILFLPPDPALPVMKVPIPAGVRAHPGMQSILAKVDPDTVYASGRALGDKFLKMSMDLYHDDLPKSPQMTGVAFIVPLLKSSDLLAESQERDKLSQLCNFYISESPEDRGVLLASKEDHQAEIIAIIESMRQHGMNYPERRA